MAIATVENLNPAEAIVMQPRSNPNIPEQAPVTPQNQPPPVGLPPEIKDDPVRESGDENAQPT
jgi:hypothetical protein